MSQRKEQPELKEYSEEVQKVLIQFMLTDNSAYVRCQNIVKPEYWNDRLRPAVRFIKKFTEEYRALPTPEQVKAETNLDLPIIPNIQKNHVDWFLDEISGFCRHKAMEALVYEGPQLIAQGDKHTGFYDDSVYKFVKGLKNRFYAEQKIKFLRKTFKEANKDFRDNSIDLLHIDGLHTYKAVKGDFEMWLPKMKKNGVVFLHDITVPHFGVRRFWAEIEKKYPFYYLRISTETEV